MSLFDSYFDPEQFQDSGGLLGRMLSLQGQRDQFQPGAGFDPQNSAEGLTTPGPPTPLSWPITSSIWPNAVPTTVGPQTPDYGQTQNIAIGDYRMPQFGRADILPPAQLPPPSNLGDRLSAGFQSWAHTPVGNPFAALANGITGFNAGQPANAAGALPTQTSPQTSAPSPDLGDRLSAGFQSWAHAPVGNPFAALANGITGVASGQRTDASGFTPSQIPAAPQSSDLGDRLSAGFQSWAHTPVGNPFAALANGIAGVASGRRTDPAGIAPQLPQPRVDESENLPQGLKLQYQALRPVLGDRKAMLAIVHPEAGKALIAQALADQTGPSKFGNASPAGVGNESSSIPAGPPSGLIKAGYFETPVNGNQAFGELSNIREREQRDTVSSDDYLSGVREGNIKRNNDGSLDVTNGTVVTLSLKDGHAKTVTVTNTDVAHIDGKTGEVVIQKSPFGDRI